MSEMIETVARAMAIENNGIDHWDVMSEDGDGYGYLGKNEFRKMAAAALAVIEEAGYEMVPEGWHICSNDA